MARRLTVIASLALLASGCALGPNYQRPELPAPEAWRQIPQA